MPAPRWTRKPPVGTPIDRSHPLSQGLASAWLLNEGTGLPSDSVGRYAATSNSMAWAGSPYGHSLQGNGTSTGVLVTPPTVSYSGPITVAALASPAASSGRQIFVSGGGYVFEVNNNGTNEINLFVGSASALVISSANAVDGGWHVFAATQSSTAAGGVQFYRDGVPWGTAAITAFPSVTTWVTSLGANSSGTGAWLKGGLGWAGAWSRAFSADEHARLAAGLWQLFRPRYPAMWEYIASAPPTGSLVGTPVVTRILYQFNAAIVATGLTFVVKVTSTGATISGTTSYDGTSHLATWTPSPSTPLVPGTLYTVTVSGATATDGTPMVPDTFSFDPGTARSGGRYFRGLGRPRGRLTA